LDVSESPPYFSTPFELRDGKAKVAFLGNAKQIKKHLENLERQARGRYRVVSLTDARFSPNSPLARLTEKQRRVLITAYKLGYYDLPRRIGSEELARKLNLVKSTFVAHRRKAERRLLTEMLSEF
jgi:predicted DNA binding protein